MQLCCGVGYGHGGSCETKGSRKLLAPLKRVSVMLNSRRVSREKDKTRATEGAECGECEEWGG